MKKLFFSFVLGLSTLTYANVNAIVSILPQETFLKAIGGEKVNISLMVKPGNSPHTYEPKPSQMRDVSKADIYFTIGVEFEEAWLPKFMNQNKKMKIVDMAKSINKIDMEKHSHDDEHKDNGDEHKDHGDEHKDHDDEHKDHDDEHDNKDPHVWTSPKNVKIIAENIYTYLVKIDKPNQAYYKENLNKFLNSVNKTDKTILSTLKDVPKDTKFLVFHPSWGYFAKQYNLIQVAIEIEGKSPKPKELIHVIEEAKEENIKAIFTSPEFSDTIAKQMASELQIPVIKISPLNPNWNQNLENFAKALQNK